MEKVFFCKLNITFLDILIYEQVKNPTEPYKPSARIESDDEAKAPKKRGRKKVAPAETNHNLTDSNQKPVSDQSTDTTNPGEGNEIDVMSVDS